MRLRTLLTAISLAAGGLSIAVAGLPGAIVTPEADALLVRIAPGEVIYYSTAEALREGQPTVPPQVTFRFDQPLEIMKRQVSQAEYAACVQDKACRPLDKAYRDQVSPDIPVVGVSWQDATDYAAWFSKQTGEHYRLPSYAEWLHAAGEAFEDTLRLDIYDSDDPAQRWLAEYALETQRKTASEPHPRPFGHYGVNAAGVQDIGGNVWDWTNTCKVRLYLDADGAPMLPPNENCGIRVVAGSHFSMITDFMRDPKSGACSVGVPPANLGIRLVREGSRRS